MMLTQENRIVMDWHLFWGRGGGAKMEEAPSTATEKGIVLLIADLTWCLKWS
jgi:hypothetical protein